MLSVVFVILLVEWFLVIVVSVLLMVCRMLLLEFMIWVVLLVVCCVWVSVVLLIMGIWVKVGDEVRVKIVVYIVRVFIVCIVFGFFLVFVMYEIWECVFVGGLIENFLIVYGILCIDGFYCLVLNLWGCNLCYCVLIECVFLCCWCFDGSWLCLKCWLVCGKSGGYGCKWVEDLFCIVGF